MTLSKPTKARFWDYCVLAARVLLAFVFISYGVAKLAGYQFGVPAEVMAQPLRHVSLPHLAWYCFEQEPFKTFIGVSQVIAGLLLLWNRTALLGALFLLPIAANIFVIDLTFLNDIIAFRYALPFYLGLILLICGHYRDRMAAAFRALTQGLTTRFAYPWWAYALLPVAAAFLTLGWLVPKNAVDLLNHPAATLRYYELLFTHLKELVG